MNAFDVKAEKANAILRYRRGQKITTLFRLMELVVFLFVISRFSVQLPVAFKLSGDYFRGLSVTVISPRFVFLLGNAIIIVLFLKAGQSSSQEDENNNIIKIDVCSEYTEKCEKSSDMCSEYMEKCEKSSEVIIHRDENKPRRKLDRSQSENLKREKYEDTGRNLRRSVTGTCQKRVGCSEKLPVSTRREEEMSSEEFRRTVEAFIARQQKSLREQELEAIVSFGP
ncbi:hypothetical protein LguiA_027531 [Lonicera macranthoides]